jgi:signal transduction histidine kinase
MFKFLRLFAVTALLSLSLAAAGLAWLHRDTTLRDLVSSSEQANTTHARLFANALHEKLGAEVWTYLRDEAPSLNATRLRDHPLTARIDGVLRTLAAGTPVLQANLVSLNGTTLYSNDRQQIGASLTRDPHFQLARRGATASTLAHHARVIAFGGHVFDRNLVTSDIPLAAPGDPRAIAVFQLHTDQSAMKAAIDDALVVQLVVLMTVMSLLFALQFMIVRQGARFIEMQELGLQTAREQLAMARQRADQASASRAEFIANVSHEIRTPMNGILGMAETLAQTPLDNQQGRCAQTILSSGRALMTMLNDMLDLSRVESGEVDLTVRPFDLKESVRSACALMSASAADKGLELKCDLSHQVPARVLGDNLRLQQVLLNLLDNAIKFTDSGSVQVSVQPTREEHAYRIAVRDTGPGLSPDERERLFQPFMQGPANGAKAPGSPLGLSLARNLVELMGGRIDVSSSPGRGSEFFIHLRLLPADGPQAKTAEAEAAASNRRRRLALQAQGL